MLTLRRIAVACLGVLLPFTLAPGRLTHPAPWVLLAMAILIQVTLPVAGHQDMRAAAAEDGNSARWILVVANLLVLVPVLDFVLRAELAPPPFSALVAVGAALVVGGALLRVWAIRVLGNAFTGVVRTTADQALVEQGPYRWLRHPSYTGMLVSFVGEAAMFRSPAGLVLTFAAMLPVYLYRIRLEERALDRHFAGAYAAYRDRTWALCPFVY